LEKIVTGQRWVSEMEPELGLGLVTASDHRKVRIRFPASDCERLYALASAPIKRVQFQPGDIVKSRTGESFVVESVQRVNDLLVYQAKGKSLPENELNDSISFTTPKDRLFSGFVDSNHEFNLRYQALKNQYFSRKSSVRGFVGGRIDLIPHQLSVSHEVASRHIPRVLLSDEVGLGKTIEACLILHRLLLAGRISRVLILVPHSLVHQWFIELLRRFNLLFRIFDADYCQSILEMEPDANPFLEDQLGICSVDFLADNAKYRQHAVAAGWDLLIIDEAHHLTEASAGYQLARALSAQSLGLLLLTATPEQLGHRSHFARLRLLDPARYPDFYQFEQEARHYHEIANVIGKLIEQNRLAPGEISLLKTIISDVKAETDLAETLVQDENFRQKVIEDLIDRFGTGRAVFRNTRAAMTGFPQRVAELIPLPAGPADLAQGTREFNVTPGQFDYENDPRIQWLVTHLKQHRNAKVLLICRTIAQVLAIEIALRQQMQVNTALFHEELSLLQRDRNAAWFAQSDGARILICSEIGSEGRNFQFAQHLVLFDLPNHPELLEQRIGRLDRIGQQQTIRIFVPYLIGSEFEILARWYHAGLNAFEKNVPGVYQIFEQIGATVREIAVERNSAEMETCLAQTRELARQTALQLEQGRDRLLELNSFRPRVAAQMLHDIAAMDQSQVLDRFMLNLFALFGIRSDELSPRTFRLNLALLSSPEFPLPAIRQEIPVVTFDRKTALIHEDIEFLSWDHPTVIGAMDLLLSSEKGNCAFTVWADEQVHEILLEGIFVVECVAPAQLHADRFLPPTPVRVLVNHKLEDRSADELVLTRRLQNNQNFSLLENPQLKQELLPEMLNECQEIATSQLRGVVEASLTQMKATLGREVQRLVELKKVNPEITEAEIARYRQEIDALYDAITTARLRLDALRLICRGC